MALLNNYLAYIKHIAIEHAHVMNSIEKDTKEPETEDKPKIRAVWYSDSDEKTEMGEKEPSKEIVIVIRAEIKEHEVGNDIVASMDCVEKTNKKDTKEE